MTVTTGSAVLDDALGGGFPTGRTVLDLIRLFADEFGATTLFTAEETTPIPGAGAVSPADAATRSRWRPAAHPDALRARVRACRRCDTVFPRPGERPTNAEQAVPP
jgi:hypothetical protein